MGSSGGHCYVTEVCSCDGVSYPIDLRLYKPAGTSEKPFRSKIELACELMDEFDPPSRHTTVQFDEWYLCGDVGKHAEDRGFDWMSEAKNNRVDFYDEEKVHVGELADRMRPFFRDVELDGELYQCLEAQGYMPRIGGVRLLFNCKADTKDTHNLCTNIKDLPTRELLKKSFERAKIESSHWDIKNTPRIRGVQVQGERSGNRTLAPSPPDLFASPDPEEDDGDERPVRRQLQHRRCVQVGRGQVPGLNLHVDRAHARSRNEYEERSRHAKTTDLHITS